MSYCSRCAELEQRVAGLEAIIRGARYDLACLFPAQIRSAFPKRIIADLDAALTPPPVAPGTRGAE